MKKLISLATLLYLSALFINAQEIGVTPIDKKLIANDFPELSLTDWEKPSYDIFQLVHSRKQGAKSWNIWLAAAPEGLMIKVVVKDKEHCARFSERTLSRGDALFVGIDARGDTPDSSCVNPFHNDDAVFVFGLGANGPDAWINKSGEAGMEREDALDMIRDIRRIEKRNLTVYELAVSWEIMNSHPALCNSFGISMTLKDEGAGVEEDLDWGTCRRWGREALGLNRFRIPDFNSRKMVVIPVKQRLYDASEEAVILVGTGNEYVDTMKISIGDMEKDLQIPSGEFSAYELRIPGELINPENSFLTLRSFYKGRVSTFCSIPIETPEVLFSRFEDRIRKLEGRASNELIRLHLESTLRVAQMSWNNLGVQKYPGVYGDPPDEYELFFNSLEYILSKLPEDRYEWKDFTSQCIPLTFAFRSSVDYSLQFYTVQMPYNWEEDSSYPLTLYLHGAGPGHPLQGLQNGFDNRWQNTLFREVDIHPDSVPAAHHGFLVAPWGRGNSSYRGYAENDIFEILDMMKEMFRIDTTQMFLSGFSMGCDGAIHIATLKPGIWAGINLASGFHQMDYWKANPRLEKLRGIPLYLWVGEMDTRMREGMMVFLKEAEKLELDYVKEIVPDLPHTYPYSEYMDCMKYLMDRKE